MFKYFIIFFLSFYVLAQEPSPQNIQPPSPEELETSPPEKTQPKKPMKTPPIENPAEKPEPVTTQPEKTQPEKKQPEKKQPKKTQPVKKQPEKTQPEKPMKTPPIENPAEESKPVATQPEKKQPEKKQPEKTQPEKPMKTPPMENPTKEPEPVTTQPMKKQPKKTQPEQASPHIYFSQPDINLEPHPSYNKEGMMMESTVEKPIDFEKPKQLRQHRFSMSGFFIPWTRDRKTNSLKLNLNIDYGYNLNSIEFGPFVTFRIVADDYARPITDFEFTFGGFIEWLPVKNSIDQTYVPSLGIKLAYSRDVDVRHNFQTRPYLAMKFFLNRFTAIFVDVHIFRNDTLHGYPDFGIGSNFGLVHYFH